MDRLGSAMHVGQVVRTTDDLLAFDRNRENQEFVDVDDRTERRVVRLSGVPGAPADGLADFVAQLGGSVGLYPGALVCRSFAYSCVLPRQICEAVYRRRKKEAEYAFGPGDERLGRVIRVCSEVVAQGRRASRICYQSLWGLRETSRNCKKRRSWTVKRTRFLTYKPNFHAVEKLLPCYFFALADSGMWVGGAYYLENYLLAKCDNNQNVSPAGISGKMR